MPHTKISEKFLRETRQPKIDPADDIDARLAALPVRDAMKVNLQQDPRQARVVRQRR
jgi:hypothetical protein